MNIELEQYDLSTETIKLNVCRQEIVLLKIILSSHLEMMKGQAKTSGDLELYAMTINMHNELKNFIESQSGIKFPTPLFGLTKINEKFCLCEDGADITKDCGCAFGQCKKGLVF